MQSIKTLANLALLVLFPIAWFAPLIEYQAGIWWLPFSNQSGQKSTIQALALLWDANLILALSITILVLIVPILKIIGSLLVMFGILAHSIQPALSYFGKISSIEIFVASILIVVATEMSALEITALWGTYFLLGCVTLSFILQFFSLPSTRSCDALFPKKQFEER